MKKFMASVAAAFILTSAGIVNAADGGVHGVVRGPVDLGLEVVVRDSGTGNWERGRSGVGVAIGGDKKKRDHTIELQLISRSDDIKALSRDELTAWYKDGIAPTGANVFISSTEDGNYAFTGVPEGSYYLVILMSGGGQLSGEPDRSADATALQEFLPAWDMYQLFTIGMKVYAVQAVDIKADQMTEFNYDFTASTFQQRKTAKSSDSSNS